MCEEEEDERLSRHERSDESEKGKRGRGGANNDGDTSGGDFAVEIKHRSRPLALWAKASKRASEKERDAAQRERRPCEEREKVQKRGDGPASEREEERRKTRERKKARRRLEVVHFSTRLEERKKARLVSFRSLSSCPPWPLLPSNAAPEQQRHVTVLHSSSFLSKMLPRSSAAPPKKGKQNVDGALKNASSSSPASAAAAALALLESSCTGDERALEELVCDCRRRVDEG